MAEYSMQAQPFICGGQIWMRIRFYMPFLREG
jgi:hypothetical protein